MKIGVAIASRGRADDIGIILQLLRGQTLRPHSIALSVTGPADLPAGPLDAGVQVVTGSPGLCAQRNRALDLLAAAECDVVVFYDDDFIPSRHALAGIRELFESHPEIAGATGRVLQDGVCHGGITLAESLEIVWQFDEQPHIPRVEDIGFTYGCNMAFRMSAVAGLRFDERLPLYGWQEDVDFSARVRERGAVVRSDHFVGVHRGVTRGRSPGRALGYSQIINPCYLAAKGTMSRAHALRLMLRNLAANHWRALRPEPHIDRAGRARGNWAGLLDLLQGKHEPENILRY